MLRAGSTSIFKGALLTVAMRWADRLIGFISTLILARLLVPEDFGIIAMASLVVGFADVFLNLGVNVALIQNRDATQCHYDAAWTLRIIQTTVSAFLILVVAPQAADYFGDPRVTPVLQFMALGLFLVGLENIGVVNFQKEMRFGLDFHFMFLKRFTGFLVTIVAAWLLRSYWALVIGTLFGRGFGVLLSYRLHPMRPRLSLKNAREIFSVSQWMVVNSIGNYFNLNLHKILVGRHTSATTMGGYTLADEISSMPTGEVLAPLNRVLFPAFVLAKHDLTELKRIFLLAQGVQTLLAIPASVGLALVANEIVAVLLGEKWLFSVPFVQLLALASVVQAITTSGCYVMLTLGAHRNVAIVNWFQVLFFVLAVFIAIPGIDALNIALYRVLASFMGLFLYVWLLLKVFSVLKLIDIVLTVFRPLFCTVVMAIAVLTIDGLTELTPQVALAFKVFLGIFVYFISVLLIWVTIGKPTGPESYLFGKIKKSNKNKRK